MGERPRTVGQLGRNTANGLVGCGDTTAGIRVGEASTGPCDEQGGAWGNALLAAQLPATNARQLGRGAGKPLGTGLPHQGRLSAVEGPGTAALAAKLVFFVGVFDPLANHGAEVGFFGGIEVCWRPLRRAQLRHAGHGIWVCATLGTARQAGPPFGVGTKTGLRAANSSRFTRSRSPFGFGPGGRSLFVWVRYAVVNDAG